MDVTHSRAQGKLAEAAEALPGTSSGSGSSKHAAGLGPPFSLADAPAGATLESTDQRMR